jgi:hypothetical protein
VGQERLGPSKVFIPLVLGPLKSLVRWEVPLGYIALRSFLFLQGQIKDIIIIIPRLGSCALAVSTRALAVCCARASFTLLDHSPLRL